MIPIRPATALPDESAPRVFLDSQVIQTVIAAQAGIHPLFVVLRYGSTVDPADTLWEHMFLYKEEQMLVRRAPDTYEKIQALGGMASDDILSRPDGARSTRRDRGPYSAPRSNPAPGVYRSALPNGKYVNLMRVMFTDFCKMDCAFCPNSHWVPRKRFAFKVDELANAFMEMYRRHIVAGLFLSSGVAGTGSKTTEKLVKVVDLIRNKHGFRGYIHMKVMPGTEEQYVEAAYRLGTRLSINLEAPSPQLMRKLSAMKELQRDILGPMEWIDRLTRPGANGVVGQATQLVVGRRGRDGLGQGNRI